MDATGDGAAAGKCCAHLMPVPASHLSTTLALVPWAWATPAIDASGWRQAANTRAFNSGEWVRRMGGLDAHAMPSVEHRARTLPGALPALRRG